MPRSLWLRREGDLSLVLHSLGAPCEQRLRNDDHSHDFGSFLLASFFFSSFKRRVPLGRAELQVTNSLAYQFICATGVLALGSYKKTNREQEKKKKKKRGCRTSDKDASGFRRSSFGG
ncbi:hypothetical protein LI328DRAFT_160074 [Trichoderma asperelloides]|nr:hypothetical protein LI328DRAFT_160074 [Trichoderma asperelloides]